MKNRQKILIIVAIIAIMFTFVPTMKVSDTSTTTVYYKSAEVRNSESSGVFWGVDPYDQNKRIITQHGKSGLRMAIEGRLKWLGITDDISLPYLCEDDATEKGALLCDKPY